MSVSEAIIRKFFWWMIMPDMFIMLLIAVGLGLLIFKQRKWGLRFIYSSCLLVLFFGMLPIGFWMLENLENRFPRVESVPADATGIILLGGNFDRMTTMGRSQPSYNIAGGRFIEFIKLARKHPELELVFTGGGRAIPFHDGPGLTEAEITKQELEALGFNTSQIMFEGESLNTIENATKTYELIKPTPDQKWVLMTSAFHLPRSVGLFRKAGWNVIPYPVDYHTPGGYEPHFLLGLKDGLTSWHYALREWAAMMQNYLFDRSDELYPAPFAS